LWALFHCSIDLIIITIYHPASIPVGPSPTHVAPTVSVLPMHNVFRVSLYRTSPRLLCA
jgi:hypothetical protein